MNAINQGAFVEAEWPDDIELTELSVNPTSPFTGIRTAIIKGVAHLIFYVEQPSSLSGAPEFVVVGRFAAPLPHAKAILDAASVRLSRGVPELSARRGRGYPEMQH